MSTTQEVANLYYKLMKQNKREQVIEELYSPSIVNKEPEHAMSIGAPSVTIGLEAVKLKSNKRGEMIEEVHSEYCSEPIVASNFFSVVLGRDLTLKGKPRMNLQEIGVFEVKDGKIVLEQFFY